MVRKYAVELKWGIIFFAITLLWMLIEKLSGLHSTYIDQHPIYTNLFAIPAIIIYVFIISVIFAALSPLGQYITHLYLSPEYFENVIRFSVETGKMTQEQAEGYFNLQSYIWQSVGSAIILGVITSAIVSLFLKKKAD